MTTVDLLTPSTAAALLLASCLAVGSESMVVLTAEEFETNESYRERGANILEKPTDPLAPQIMVERPELDEDVAPPVDVSVRFQPADGAEIDLDSLQIKYGWFDITERVLESMDVSSEGISGKISTMRRGRYSIRLSIQDTMERESETRIEFRIVRDAD